MHLRSSRLSQTKESLMSYGRKIGRQDIGSKKIHRYRLFWVGSGAINTGFLSISELSFLRVSLFDLFWDQHWAHAFASGFSGAGPRNSNTNFGTLTIFLILFLFVSGFGIQYSLWGKRSDFDNPSAQSLYYCFDWWNYHVDLKLCRLFACLSYFFVPFLARI